MFKSSSQRQGAIRACEDFLARVEVGAVVPYAEIEATIHSDPQSQWGRSVVLAARRRLLADSILFDFVKNVGLMRLGDSQKICKVQKRSRHVFRESRRGKREIATVTSIADLSDSDRSALLTEQIRMELTCRVTSGRNRKAIANAVSGQAEAPVGTEAVQMFLQAMKGKKANVS